MNHRHVLDLPPEMYFVVAHYLSEKDLAASVLVCKIWFLYFRSHLWKELDIRKRDRLQRFENVPETALLRNAHVIQTLRTPFSEVIRTFATLGTTCTNLRNLRVKLESADLDAVLHLIRQNIYLQEVSVRGGLILKEENLLRVIEALPLTISKLTLGSMALATFSDAEDSDEEEDEEDEEDEENEEVQDEEEHLRDIVRGINMENRVWALTSLTIRHEFYFCRTLHQFIMRAPLLETLCLKNIAALDVQRLSACLNQCCPSLTTLRVRTCNDSRSYYCPEEDEAMATVIAGGCQHGWKKLDIKGNVLGNASYEAIMVLVPSLESIVYDFLTGFEDWDLQKILCSAPFLKELIVHRSFQDICTAELDCRVIDGDPWVCHSLETLKVVINHIPRPDVRQKTNGKPLTGWLHQGRMRKSYKLQQRVYRQLGAMTKLKNLILGTRINEDVWEQEQYEDERETEGKYYDHENFQQGRQYDCLSFTLESGLGLLCGLRELETIDLRNMSVGLMQEAELQWVRWNWPHLRAIHIREFDDLAEKTSIPTPQEFHRESYAWGFEDEEFDDEDEEDEDV
ncbi:hypothetical protein BGZ72_009815 [Mortierella alpina]|nr:hypothetical protein BGZ72_009815 [Mortierella alpina]